MDTARLRAAREYAGSVTMSLPLRNRAYFTCRVVRSSQGRILTALHYSGGGGFPFAQGTGNRGRPAFPCARLCMFSGGCGVVRRLSGVALLDG